MKIKEASARSLLLALGYKNASDYGEATLARKLQNVEREVDGFTLASVKDPGLSRLLKSVLSANRQKEGFEFVSDAPPRQQIAKDFGDLAKDLEGPRPVGRPPADGIPRPKPRPYRKRNPQEDMALNIAAVQPKQKPVRDEHEFDGYAPTLKKPHQPGTIMRTIFDVLRAATPENPVSRLEVLERLKEEFPLKDPVTMYSTVMAFPNWLPKHYPYEVHQTDKRYWLEPVFAEDRDDQDS